MPHATTANRVLHRWKVVVSAVAVAVVAFSVACAPRYVMSREGLAGSMPSESLTRHVIVVSIDGLRPDAIARFDAPTLQRLVRDGGYTLSARTILPSKTLPSHTSMLTGEPPERHHVLWNSAVPSEVGDVAVPTIFGVARAHGYRTAAFFSKSKFQSLQLAGTLDYSQAPGGWWGRWSSDRTLADVTDHLKSASPNLLFVHLSDPDRAGHSDGWMSPSYGQAVAQADRAVAGILDAADKSFGEGNYAMIVTADHGGHGYDHGSDDPRDVTIPWVAWGRGVKAGELQAANVRTMDTASTALWLLGIDEPADWMGQPVTTAFIEPTVVQPAVVVPDPIAIRP